MCCLQSALELTGFCKWYFWDTRCTWEQGARQLMMCWRITLPSKCLQAFVACNFVTLSCVVAPLPFLSFFFNALRRGTTQKLRCRFSPVTIKQQATWKISSGLPSQVAKTSNLFKTGLMVAASSIVVIESSLHSVMFSLRHDACVNSCAIIARIKCYYSD